MADGLYTWLVFAITMINSSQTPTRLNAWLAPKKVMNVMFSYSVGAILGVGVKWLQTIGMWK